jgi:hypothetical protein
MIVSNAFDYSLTGQSIYYSTLFALTVPILANIGPIKEAMNKNLRSSLN